MTGCKNDLKITMNERPLVGEYTIREMNKAELMPFFSAHRADIFENTLDFDVHAALSEGEKSALKTLAQNSGTPYTLHLGIFLKGELVGWSYGWQESAEKYYMCNTGILKEHRRKGIYTALLPEVLKILKAQGFQVAYSRHAATNNDVIIPKLRAGFVISGMEISDKFGTLVHLSYFFNDVRRRAMDFRSGQAAPDEELKKFLKM
jgi:ribosomal protein S18 acetylase RimI-like enzyme